MIPNTVIRVLPESNIKHRLEDINHIERLPVAEAGESDEGLCFITLQNELTFYGYPSFEIQRYIYRLFVSSSFQKRVPESAYGVAWDIWLRYHKGGHINQQKEYKLKPGDTVIEAGAYIGYYTLKMSEDVGPKGHIVAIEPVEKNRRIILKNIEANNIKNVTVVPCAVWNKKGTTTFYMTNRQKNSLIPQILRGRGQVQELTVATDTIDNIINRTKINPPALVIITVNGAEVEALEGMPVTLKNDNLHLVVAAKYVVNGVPIIERVKALLEQSGYTTVLDHRGFVKNRNPKQQAVVYASH